MSLQNFRMEAETNPLRAAGKNYLYPPLEIADLAVWENLPYLLLAGIDLGMIGVDLPAFLLAIDDCQNRQNSAD